MGFSWAGGIKFEPLGRMKWEGKPLTPKHDIRGIQWQGFVYLGVSFIGGAPPFGFQTNHTETILESPHFENPI